MAGPRANITPPPATPRRLSLLSAAKVVEDPELRWGNGITFEPELCSARGGVEDPDDCGTPGTFSIGANDATVNYEPFLVWEGDSCSPFQRDRDPKALARRRLLACQSRHIERELWRGDQALTSSWPNRWLAHPASDVLTNASVTPARALACLEQGLAECGCGQRGMIHASPQIVSRWAEDHLISREANLLLTINDNIVVPGVGYDGSGPCEGACTDEAPEAPEDAADGSIWAYATGLVHVRLGPIVMVPDNDADALERTQNTLEYTAQRAAVAYFDNCCHLAVEIDEDLCGIGGAGS